MSRIIKKGKCEYRPIPSGCTETAAPADDSVNDEQQHTFNSLSVVIEADFPAQGQSRGGTRNENEELPEEEESVTPDHAADQGADTILEDARREAARIREDADAALREAQRRGEVIESEAYSLGFDQGKKDGEEIGRKQYQAVAQRMEKLLEKINEGAEGLLPQFESQMVEVAMNTARHIVDREIQISPDIVLESIRAAMTQVVEGSAVHLHLNPDDIEALEDEIRQKFVMPGGQGLDIVSDPRIERGGCLIETEFGLVDATTRAKWQAVSATIKKILAERTGSTGTEVKNADDIKSPAGEEEKADAGAHETAGDAAVTDSNFMNEDKTIISTHTE